MAALQPTEASAAGALACTTAARALGSVVLLGSLVLLTAPPLAAPVLRGGALLVLVAWMILRSREFELRSLIGWRGVLAASGWALAVAAPDENGVGIGACLLVGALAATWRSGGAAAASVATGAALTAVLWTARLANPWLLEPVDEAVRAITAGIGSWFGRSWRFTPSALGADTLVPCAAALMARYALVARAWRRLAAGLAALVAVAAVQAETIHRVAHGASREVLALLPWLVAMPLALLVTSALLARRHDAGPRGEHRWIRGTVFAASACVALALAGSARVVDAAPTAKIAFHDRNRGPIVDWKVPRYGDYGPYSLGLYGLLPELLRADGYEVAFIDETVGPEALDGVATLVVINADTAWTEDELLAVWRFVDRGGSLVVLGDHTNAGGTLRSHNDLLAPFGIAFRFDSAVPASWRGWDAAEFPAPALLGRAGAANDLAISIGASLDLQNPALPLIRARHALLDAGDAAAPERAYLGDYAYQPGEGLGSAVLAAWAPLGRGKAIVFGDTSGFQNVTSWQTYEPWLRRLFGCATGRLALGLGRWGFVAAGVVMALCGIVAVVAWRTRPLAALGLALALWGVTTAADGYVAVRLARPPLEIPTMLVDESHVPRAVEGLGGRRGMGALENAALRSGYLPRGMPAFDAGALAEADVLVTIAPVRPYAEDEVEALVAYMEQGGFVIAGAGHPESEGVRPLLDRLGVDVLARPIGSIPLKRRPGRARTQVEYVDAWELSVAEHARERTWVYGAFEGLPLAVLVRQGAGGLFFVGDSFFFGADNLETHDEHSEPNILMLRGLLDDFAALREEESG